MHPNHIILRPRVCREKEVDVTLRSSVKFDADAEVVVIYVELVENVLC